MASSRQRVFIEAVPMVALTATICVLDVLTSLAWSVWLLYFIPLALVLHRSPNPVPYQFAALATFLTMLGGYLSPPDIHPDVALFNRCLGMAVMWGFTWYTVKQKPVQASLDTETARSHAAPAATVAGRPKVEEQLLISRLRLESIIESAMDAIITVDEDQKIVLFNHAAEQMFGCSTREAIGRTLDRFLPERFREAHRHHIHTFGQSGVTSRKMGKLGIVMGLRSNDEEFPIEAAISHIALDGKKYYTVILRDISERKRAEDLLQESQRQLTTLIGNLPGFVYRCRNDRGWIFEYLSDGVSDLTGYPAEEYLVQRTISYGQNTHPDDRERVRHEIQAALEQHRSFELTYRILTKAGEVKWVWERGEGIYAQDGTLSYLEGFVTDVTERKRAERLLRQSE
ncbi:MAG TPA: PAS domain S-box protein, partial [Nitrospira sp.]|nr:PAS domain S-box protein [Nitrospira sp.]